MEITFLKDLFIIFGVSAIVVFLLGKFNIPSIIGFLVAGVILGPHGFGFIEDVHQVELLAEIGVILLMFTIGLEFSLKHLMNLRTAVLGGGFTQVSLTIIVTAVISYFFLSLSIGASIFQGFLIALSSTAIVMKLLLERGEINTPHGNISVGILIFQDLCVVPFMLLLPILAGQGGSFLDIIITHLKAAVVVGAVLVSAKWGVPHLLHQVVHTKSRELFIITIILLCIGTALLTSELGLSLALGAFLAGIVVSESDYASQAISDILPFKESFTGLFFISVGMLMNLQFVITHLLTDAIIVTLIIIMKFIIITVSAFVFSRSLGYSLQSGLSLSQIGEFSFIVAVAGRKLGLMTEDFYQIFLSASVITMFLTPFLFYAAPSLASALISKTFFRRFDKARRGLSKEAYPEKKTDHVMIIGFGVNGSNLARVLHASGIPYVVLELNTTTVRRMKKKGEPIYYGDGTSREILHKIGIQKAKVLVIAISDPAATRRMVQIARLENPHLFIIVRTRYIKEIEDLNKIGANEVIPEEFETSVEIFSRVLHHYQMPGNVIHEHINKIREDSYRVFRSTDLPKKHLAERYDVLSKIDTEFYQIKKPSPVEGYSVKELRLRSETGATIITVQRGENVHTNPSPDFTLQSGDIIMLIGTREDINRAIQYLESEKFLADRYDK
jgi:CPA2 family monovalent cation:H+ antiporter-2